MAFHMGYVGYSKLTPSTTGTPVYVRITGSSLNPVQAINAPDLVGGEYNKRAWNYGPIETGGNLTGPLGETTSLVIAECAWNRHADGDRLLNTVDVEIYFFKHSVGPGATGRKFASCQVNSFALSVTAGDVATFTLDFMGTRVTTLTGYTDYPDKVGGVLPCEKLVTWDKCSLTFTPAIVGLADINNELQAWTLNINNNLKRINVIGQTSLYPVQILASIRDISGTIAIYASDTNNALLDSLYSGAHPTATGIPPFAGADSYSEYSITTTTPTTGTFTIGEGATQIVLPLKMYWTRAEVNATTDTVMYNINFTGLCNDTTTPIG